MFYIQQLSFKILVFNKQSRVSLILLSLCYVHFKIGFLLSFRVVYCTSWLYIIYHRLAYIFRLTMVLPALIGHFLIICLKHFLIEWFNLSRLVLWNKKKIFWKPRICTDVWSRKYHGLTCNLDLLFKIGYTRTFFTITFLLINTGKGNMITQVVVLVGSIHMPDAQHS